MDASRLTLAVIAAALLAAGQARAHFLPTFAPAPHGGSGHFGPPPCPDHRNDAFRIHHHRGLPGFDGDGGLYLTPDLAAPEEPAQQQAEPLTEPLFLPAPARAARAVSAGPRIII